MKKVMVVIASVVVFSVLGCAMNKSLHIPAGNGDLVQVKAEIEKGTKGGLKGHV